MARSEYIYLVRGSSLLGDGVPVAAFTVKSELRRWLALRSPAVQRNLSFYRMKDGGGKVTEILLEELID